MWIFVSGQAGRAQQPPPTTLISNANQAARGSISLLQHDFAQSFTTGTHLQGYILTSIELGLDRYYDAPSTALFRGSADGTKVADLQAASREAGETNYTFRPDTASGTLALDASTTYWIVAEGHGRWRMRERAGVDASSAQGWRIGSSAEWRAAHSSGPFTALEDGGSLWIQVSGTLNDDSAATDDSAGVANAQVATPHSVLVTNIGTVRPDSLQIDASNVVEEFETGPNPGGYSVTSIEVRVDFGSDLTVPTVRIEGVAVGFTTATDATPEATILEYRPDAPVTLSRRTAYWAVVYGDAAGSDVLESSTDGPWLIRVNGSPIDPDRTPPEPVSAVLDGALTDDGFIMVAETSSFTITFDEQLAIGDPPLTAFEVTHRTAGGASEVIEIVGGAWITYDKVWLNVALACYHVTDSSQSEVTVSYTKPASETANRLSGPVG